MKNIVISLKSAIARREHIQQQFGQQQIEFEFFDALTPADAVDYAKKISLKFEKNTLTQGELACFMSHVAIWENMIKHNLEIVAVFEDDVFLGQHADSFLNQDDWLPNTWSIIKLEAFSRKVLLARSSQKTYDDRQIFELKGKHLGAAGYILRIETAKYLLDLLKNQVINEPLDHILFDLAYHQHRSEFKLYQLKPALCIQGYLYQTENSIFASGLETQRVERRKKESQNRNLYTKFLRELSRLYVQLHQLWYKKPMDFK